MKKFKLLMMITLAIAIFSACQKDEPIQQMDEPKQLDITDPMFADLNEIAFSVEDNRLVFESEEEFQKCIDFLAQLGDEKFPKFEEVLGFESYRKTFEDDEIKSEIFSDELYQTLLTPEMEIVIGNHLFREEPESKSTLAFENNLEKCNLKTTDLSPTFIFSWDDDAFAILEGEEDLYLKSTAGYCSSNNDEKEDSYIRSGNWDATTASDPFAYYRHLRAKLCFQKTGIFKSIISKFKFEDGDMQCYRQYQDGFYYCDHIDFYRSMSFKSVGDAIYDRKGKAKKKRAVYEICYPHGGDYEISWRPFYGTRNVQCYNITMDFTYKIYSGAVAPHTNDFEETERLSINCNQSSCL